MKRVLLFIAAALSCHAQDVPAGPWVSPIAGGFACWKIDYQYADSARRSKEQSDRMQAVRSMAVGDPAYAKMASNPAMQLALVPPRPTESVVTRTKDLRQTKTSYEGGVAGEEWNDGIVDLNLRPGTGAVTADLVGNDPSYKDFHEFSWINSSNFQARKKNGDHDYLVFQQKMPALAVLDLRLFNNLKSSDPSSEQVTSMVLVTATVDATSKLPVSLQIGDEVHTYTFLQPNDVMLVMPPKFAAVERQTLAIYQAMHKQRPMP